MYTITFLASTKAKASVQRVQPVPKAQRVMARFFQTRAILSDVHNFTGQMRAMGERTCHLRYRHGQTTLIIDTLRQ